MCLQGGSVGGGVGRFHAIGEDFPWYMLYSIQKNIAKNTKHHGDPLPYVSKSWHRGRDPPGLDWEYNIKL